MRLEPEARPSGLVISEVHQSDSPSWDPPENNFFFTSKRGIRINKHSKVDFVSSYIQDFYSLCLSVFTKQKEDQ